MQNNRNKITVGQQKLGKTSREDFLKGKKTEEFNTLHASQEERNEELTIKPDHEHEREFREGVHTRLKNIKGRKIEGLGIVKRFKMINKGETAILAVLEIEDSQGQIKNYVFKTCYKGRKIEIEGVASKKRRQEGADVIEILHQGTMDINNREYPYIILPYKETDIQPEDLSRQEKQEVAEQRGENLALMHKVKGTGFGAIKDPRNLVGEKNEFTFKETIMDINIREFLIKRGLFEKEELESFIQKACNIIKEDFKTGEKPTLIHHDVSLQNTFITKTPAIEIMFYDLDAELGHPMEDLALGMREGVMNKDILTAQEIEQGENALIKGYQKNGGKYDENIVNACMFLTFIRKGARALYKCENMHKDTKEGKGRMERGHKYINNAKEIAKKLQ